EYLLFVPRALADELLERLLGILTGEVRREGNPARQGLDALPLAVGKKPVEVHSGPPCRLGLWEVRREASRVFTQALQNRRIEVGGERLHDPLERRDLSHASPF